MLRSTCSIFLAIILYFPAYTQRLLTKSEANELAVNNQRNLKAANLSLRQQQELLNSAAGLENPEVFAEANPYEPILVGVEQRFSLPGVYRSRKALQNERIQLARLQLQGSKYELKREVSLSYSQLQYLTEKLKLLRHQDSIYQAIKISSQRFFDAGQINKLEELLATSQADKVRNELLRAESELAGETQLFRFFTGYADPIYVEPFENYGIVSSINDTQVTNIQQQILQQEIIVNERELKVQRSGLLPQVKAGVSFPTTRDYIRPVGFQAGISLPIWGRQNRSRVQAAETAIEIAKARQELEQLRLDARYRLSLANYQRERQTLDYFTSTGLMQANAIIETSKRLFDGGQLNYIESLRNLQNAFEIFLAHLEVQRAYNESIIELNYLNGTM